MKFSLVMTTVDRSVQLERFMFHLNRQVCRDFELIVVDQNQDERVAPILASYMDRFPILHIKSNELGASRGRNLGLQHARGEIIAFPDDDCWYASDLLVMISDFFEHNLQWDGLTVRLVGVEGKTVALRFDNRSGKIGRYNAWRRVVTSTMFLRCTTVKALEEGFDEELGVGAGTPWGAAEETDYMIRLVSGGYRIYYDPQLNVYHPDPMQLERGKLLSRGYSYGCGFGRVMRKNHYPLWFFVYYLIRSAGGAVLALLRGDWTRVSFYRESIKGRLYGWRRQI